MNLLTEIENVKYNKNESVRLLKILLNFPNDQRLELSEKLEDVNNERE